MKPKLNIYTIIQSYIYTYIIYIIYSHIYIYHISYAVSFVSNVLDLKIYVHSACCFMFSRFVILWFVVVCFEVRDTYLFCIILCHCWLGIVANCWPLVTTWNVIDMIIYNMMIRTPEHATYVHVVILDFSILNNE